MSLIDCPYCQSSRVRPVDSYNSQSNFIEQLQRYISLQQMVAFGIHIARKTDSPPFAGVVIGVVVGGVLNVVSQYCFEKFYRNATTYVCLNCERSFARAADV